MGLFVCVCVCGGDDYQIYFNECGKKKNQYFHLCIARVKKLIFSTHKLNISDYLQKKGSFFYFYNIILYSMENIGSKIGFAFIIFH